jgi:DNA-binding NarL/FixJ family response regulator
MPGLSGVEVASRILADIPGQLIVLFSAYLNNQIIAEATHLGVAACVSKVEAINLPEIIRAVVANGFPT